MVQDLASFGGMWMLDNGVNLCTSGFSVKRIGTTTAGIATAGHCSDNLDQINHPGHGLHSLTGLYGQHTGIWGDFQWHTTNVLDYSDFYASSTEVRDVDTFVPAAAIHVGDAICFYGRKSNQRDCSLTVQDVSQACTNDGVFNDRLVMMNGSGVAKPGDSGGPWFFGLAAYGLTKGFCYPDYPTKLAFSKADHLDEAMGVEVVCGFGGC